MQVRAGAPVQPVRCDATVEGKVMSEAAAQPEAPEVEAAEGQGAESSEGNDLYASFLDGVPEEIHDQVIPALKAQDAEFTKKFQSRSERVKPFEEKGILDSDPEQLGQYLQLDQAMAAAQQGDAEAAEAVYQWWDKVGEALNFYDAGKGDDSSEAETDEEFDVLDMDAKSFQDAVRKQVEQAVGPIAQQLQTREQQEAKAREEQQINETVDGWISEVKSANPQVFEGEGGEEVMEQVLELAGLFTDSENPVQAGFERYQSLVSKGEAGLFAKKAQQPNVPEGAGRPDTTPPVPTMKNARDLALQYVENGKAMT
jgi:hypothetical protein